jgi:hypothetical protein
MLVVFYFSELFVFCNYVCFQQICLYVLLYIHSIQYLTLFVWVHYCNYCLLTTSFSCTLSYMEHDYWQLVVFHFLYIHAIVWHLTLFVWVHYYNYLLLTVSFSCTHSYMQHDYYQRTSYQCVTSYAASLRTVLCHTVNSGIELAI